MTLVLETSAGEDRRVVADADLDRFTGKQRLQLLLKRRDRLLDDQIVLRALRIAPDNQADGPGCFPIDQDLARRDHDGIGDGRIRDGDPGDVEVGRQHHRSARGQDDPQARALPGSPGAPGPAPAPARAFLSLQSAVRQDPAARAVERLPRDNFISG